MADKVVQLMQCSWTESRSRHDIALEARVYITELGRLHTSPWTGITSAVGDNVDLCPWALRCSLLVVNQELSNMLAKAHGVLVQKSMPYNERQHTSVSGIVSCLPDLPLLGYTTRCPFGTFC
jgi:hypothetical protein